jgi:glycine/D-amino acid oxidase-like deaminating enzyme
MSTTHTVILGSGIIGLSTAYFLTESGNTDPLSIVLLDSSAELFHCASGFAGGFCAQDCGFCITSSCPNYQKSDKTIGFAPSVASLGALSFALHKRLADENNGRATWGYSPSTGISLSQDSESAIGGSGEDWLDNGTSRAEAVPVKQLADGAGGAPEWLRRTQDGTIEVISREGTTAQIDPLRFCRWLLARCEERGVTVTYPARAVGVLRDANGVLDRVRVNKDGVESTRMIYPPESVALLVSRHTQLTVPTSPVYPPPHRSRRMVPARLRDAVPERTNSHPHLVARGALAAGAQPAV